MSKHTPVLCINSGDVYPSARAAASAIGVTESSMSNHLSGKRKTCNGFLFVRLNGSESEDEIIEIRCRYLQDVYGIAIII